MKGGFEPVLRQSLADRLARRIRGMIQNGSDEIRRLLTTAGENLDNDDVLNPINMAFHQQIALASGNTVLAQLRDVLQDLFTEEQRLILGIFGSRSRDHQEHLAIFEALEKRDEALAVERMRTHLERVRAAVEQWDPEHHPVS